MPSFSIKSEQQLATCDARLQKLFNEVVKHWDCTIVEGKRTEERELELFNMGATTTLNSKHVYPKDAPSLAVDVAPYPVKWNDTQRMYAFGGFVVGVATMLGIPVRWGGDWDSDRDLHDQKFNDLCHFELSK